MLAVGTFLQFYISKYVQSSKLTVLLGISKSPSGRFYCSIPAHDRTTLFAFTSVSRDLVRRQVFVRNPTITIGCCRKVSNPLSVIMIILFFLSFYRLERLHAKDSLYHQWMMFSVNYITLLIMLFVSCWGIWKWKWKILLQHVVTRRVTGTNLDTSSEVFTQVSHLTLCASFSVPNFLL